MPKKQILFNGLVRAVDLQDAATKLLQTPWIYAFPQGVTEPGKIIPLRTQYDSLRLDDLRVVSVTPYVPSYGTEMHNQNSVSFLVAAIITFAHDDPRTMETLLQLGTWFSPPVGLFDETSWSSPAPDGAFAELLNEED